MLRTFVAPVIVAVGIGVTLSAQAPRRVPIGDWPEMRGPNRDGQSRETGLIDKWVLNGENFLWRAPYGGRSAPIVMGNHLYVQNPSGRGTSLQERVMALDVETGKVVWEYKFNLFQSDVPSHRIAWASPAADHETGNIYALSGGAQVIALSKDGKLLWERSFGEEFAAFTTHGGRTMSPLIDGNLVIVAAAVSNWGTSSNRAHRIIALDKRTGDVVYVANPGGRPYDTAYASPMIATINGTRQLIVGLGDGAIHSIKPQTGEKIWSYIASKRAINTGVVVNNNSVFVSHGDENTEGNELGLLAAIDGSQTGDIKTSQWAVKGLEFLYSPPLVDSGRLYQIDGSSTLHAYEVEKGTPLWELSLSTAQKAPPVMADGKIFVGTDAGKFFIVRPGLTKGEIVSSVELPVSKASCCGSEGTPEQILAGAAISRGRVFFVSSDAIYAIGGRKPTAPTGFAADEALPRGEGAPAYVQVVPTELVLEPGQTVKFTARVFDAKGRYLRDEPTPQWSLEGLKGTVEGGSLKVAADPVEQAGLVKATVGDITGQARARIVRPLPWKESFDSLADGSAPAGWVNAVAGKISVTTLDGQKVLQKAADDTIFKRIRAFVGPANWSNYTFEADVRASTRRRQMGDIGITAQRYSLVLYGNSQRLKIEPWEPETQRTVTVPFAWKPDAWYRLKLRVENLPDGQVRAQGKAWAVGEPEPQAWTIEKVDPMGNRQGAPGLFIDAQFGAYLDNISLTKNQ